MSVLLSSIMEQVSVLNVLVTLLLMYMVWILVDLFKTRNMPPGPIFGVPVLGHVHLLDGDNLKNEMELAKKYGPVFTLQLGSYRTVYATGEKAVKEVLVKKSSVFSGRPSLPLFDVQTFGLGVAMSDDNPSWKLHRKMFMAALRDFMANRESFQECVEQEKIIMREYLLEHAGKPIDPQHILTLSVANVICHLTFGKHFNGDETDYVELIKWVNISMNDETIIKSPINFIPWLVNFPSEAYSLAKKAADIVNDTIRRYFKEHEETYDPSNIRDVIDGFLKAKADAIEEEKSSIQSMLSDTHMVVTLGDMFVAGYETTTTTLRWAVLLLANDPEWQREVQDEMDEVVGKERAPTLEDKGQLPLLQATIMEIQRLGNIAPEALPHRAKEDTTLCGYHIPKDTMVIVNLFSVHMDENVFEEPQKFNPRRFIGPDGYVTTGKGNFLPFSAGRRVCAGESLAKAELFLFLSDILFHFNIKRKSSELIEFNPLYGVTRAPGPYDVIFEPRQ